MEISEFFIWKMARLRKRNVWKFEGGGWATFELLPTVHVRKVDTSIYSMTCYFAYFFARILDRLWSMTSSRLHRLIYAKLTHFHQKVASFHVVGSWLGILCKWQIIKTFPTLFLNFVDMLTGWTRAALDTLVVSQAATILWATRYKLWSYYDCFIRVIDNYDKSL